MERKVKRKEAQKKEVGFITIINIIVGVILAIFCVLTLIMGLYLVGVLFLILAVFIFLPQGILKFSKWLKLLIGVVGFFVLLVIVGLNMPSQEPVFESYNLNEPFILSPEEINISMVVYNATKEDTLTLNGEETTSQGVFLKVNGALINLEKSPVNIKIGVGVIDNQNNSYAILGYNLGEGPLQPNLRREIFYIFEIPKQVSGLKFIVEEDRRHFKEINLEI